MSPLDRELFEAVAKGNSEAITPLISLGAKIEARIALADYGAFFSGLTPLMVAAGSAESNLDTIKALLAQGADLHAKSSGNVSAAWYAAGRQNLYTAVFPESMLKEEGPYDSGGDSERLQYLLDRGLDPNEVADNGISLLSQSCSAGDSDRVRLLLDRGASPQPRAEVETGQESSPFFKEMASLLEDLKMERNLAEEGIDSSPEFLFVPLFEACKSGSAECVQLILSSGFPADFRSGSDNALHHAGSVEVVELLAREGVMFGPGDWGRDPADIAVENELYDVAKRFWEVYVPQDKRQEYFDAKLRAFAGHQMSPRAIEILLKLGANARWLPPGGQSVLHETCWQGDGNGGRPTSDVEETLKLLIQAGANPNHADEYGNTPLHEAAYGDWGSPTSVRVLLESGAEPSPADRNGNTPLHLAADRCELECIRLLLKFGASPRLRNSEGKTAVDMARRYLESWRSIVKSGPVDFLAGKGIPGYEFDPVEDQAHHVETLREAERALEILEAGPPN